VLRGSTLAKMHYDWRSGTTLFGALTAGRNVGLRESSETSWHFGIYTNSVSVGIATVFSTIVVIDGPFLQRSTSVVKAPILDQPVTLAVKMVQELPTDYTGGRSNIEDLGYAMRWNYVFNESIPTSDGGLADNNMYFAVNTEYARRLPKVYYSNDPFTGVISGCEQTCSATIRAPALSIASCTSEIIAVNYSIGIGMAQTSNLGSVAPPLTSEGFFVANNLLLDEYERLSIQIGYSSIEDCVGTLNFTVCTLESALGEYNITIENDKIALDNPANPRIVKVANNTRVNRTPGAAEGGFPSTLAGVATLQSEVWDSQVSYYVSRGEPIRVDLNRPILSQYERTTEATCASFSDPFWDAIANLNKIMVYNGALAALESPSFLEDRLDPGVLELTNTTTTGYLVGDHNIFQTNYWWFFAAAFVELVCICFV
jgi:hypothetical protein